MSSVPVWPGAGANGGGGGTAPNNNLESVPSVSTSDGTNESSETGMEDDSNDAEGVWSPDIEQSFMVRQGCQACRHRPTGISQSSF